MWLLQRVDARGAMPDKESQTLSCTVGPRAGGQSVSKVVSIPFVIHGIGDGSAQNRNYYCWAPPPFCLPSLPNVTARDQISQAFPPYLHTASDQILEVGTA